MPDQEIERSYRLLDVKAGASRKEIRSAYLALVNVWHPDRFQHDAALQVKALAKLQAINVAFAAIRDAPLAGGAAEAEPASPAAPPKPEAGRRSAAEWAALGRQLTGDNGRLRADGEKLAWADITDLGRFLEGVRAFREALKLDPRLTEAWYGLGLAQLAQGEYALAVEALEKVVRFSRDHARAWLALGSAAAERGWYEKAANAFDEVVRLRPHDAAAWYALGSARTQTGETERSQRAFRRAVELDPDLAEGWLALGVALAFPGPEGRVEPEEALAAFRRAVRLRPDLAEGWHGVGATLSGLGRHDEAIEPLQQALCLRPDSSEFWYSLGVAARYATTAKASRAVREAYARLKRLDPSAASRLRELLPYSMRLSLLAFLPRVDGSAASVRSSP